jgi:heme oxygenase
MSAAAASLPLSSRLRLETREAHARAERSGIMRRLLRGELDRAAYAELLVALAAIYEALESELDRHQALPAIAPFAFGALRRHAALSADIAALGDTDAPFPAPCVAARAYAAHLRRLGASAPALLVAHAYVRYLGDLAGGQILKRIVSNSLGLVGDTGTAFYDFTDLGDPGELRQQVRNGLDALPPSAADALVAEALNAFAMHEHLFTELDAMR